MAIRVVKMSDLMGKIFEIKWKILTIKNEAVTFPKLPFSSMGRESNAHLLEIGANY
ncbi:MAG: hypothetical protein ACI9FN_002619 [Saprospiraceae bacterium]|jgi:hypothetical protein